MLVSQIEQVLSGGELIFDILTWEVLFSVESEEARETRNSGSSSAQPPTHSNISLNLYLNFYHKTRQQELPFLPPKVVMWSNNIIKLNWEQKVKRAIMLLLQLLLLIWKLSFYKIQGFSKIWKPQRRPGVTLGFHSCVSSDSLTPTTRLTAQKLLSTYHCSDTALTVGKGWAWGGCSHHWNPFFGGNTN